MKLTRHIIILSAVLAIASCGTSKQFRTQPKPTIVVDTKPTPADTITGEISDNDTIVADTVYADDTTPFDSVPFTKATDEWKQSITAGVDSLLNNPLLETSVCGIELWDLDDDISLYRHDERQRLRPASTMKVMTAITALKELGDDYNFTTKVYYTGSASDSTANGDDAPRSWHGDIYVVGGMTPTISQSDIASLARTIRQQGVDSIFGTVYADQSFKDGKKWASGWCWDDKHNPLLLPLKYNNKDNFVEEFISQLRRNGIYVSGSQGTRTLPSRSTRCVAELRRSLKSVMRPMLKNSNNNCAESVFYAMIHSQYGDGVTASQGQTMIRSLMTKAGITNAASYDIVDGCGLSLYDYLSPHAEVMMLRYAWSHKDIYDPLYPLLPIAARDGTLRKRMHGTRAAGNVHAKTGTVTGVRSLCGYLTAANGHHIAFSIMNQGVNGDDGTASEARNLQDRICEMLCNP